MNDVHIDCVADPIMRAVILRMEIEPRVWCIDVLRSPTDDAFDIRALSFGPSRHGPIERDERNWPKVGLARIDGKEWARLQRRGESEALVDLVRERVAQAISYMLLEFGEAPRPFRIGTRSRKRLQKGAA